MHLSGAYVDANLLLLRVVGDTDPGLIAKHRRLKTFSRDDYALLAETLSSFDKILVASNTLTETSNLLAQHRDPERSSFLRRLRSLIDESKEVLVSSVTASNNEGFVPLGLTDATLLEVVSDRTPLITVDGRLYRAALLRGHRAGGNFTHLRSFQEVLPPPIVSMVEPVFDGCRATYSIALR